MIIGIYVIPFHPGVEATASDSKLRLQHGRTSARFTAFSNHDLTLEETEMYPAFGEKLQRISIVMDGSGEFPMLSGFVLSVADSAPDLTITGSAPGDLNIGSLILKSTLLR